MTNGILLNGSADIDFMIHGVFPYQFFGQTVWITTTHICLLIVLLLILAFAIAANRAMKHASEVPGFFQNIVELVVEKLDGMVKMVMGKNAAKFANYIGDNYALSVSMTTRKPREGEIDGVSYFFVDHDTFEQTIAQDGLVEYASYVGNYYGTPKAWVEEQRNSGKDVVLEIEVQGALKVKEKFPDAVLIFVLPPSAKELKSRLEGRGTETQAVVLKRLSRAEEESAFVEQYDYIVVNDDLGACMEAVNGIVRAEHQRPNLNLEHITNLKEELNALVKGEN